MNKLERAIVDFIGPNPAMVAEFQKVLLQIHREREAVAVENNIAIREVCSNFGLNPQDLGAIRRKLRSGRDGDKILRFDEMAEYACKHYRHLMPACNGESDSGTDEHAFTQWLERGIVDVPKATDPDILEATATRLGPGFFDDFANSPVEQPLPLRKTATKHSSLNNQSMSELFKYFGFNPSKFGAVVRMLRSGKGTAGVPRFDEMAEYACSRFGQFIAEVRHPGDTNQKAFAKWVARGYISDSNRSTDNATTKVPF